MDITIKPLPGSEDVADAGSQNSDDNGTLNGVTVSDLDQQARQQYNIPAEVKGAVITQVDPTSASARSPGGLCHRVHNRHSVGVPMRPFN